MKKILTLGASIAIATSMITTVSCQQKKILNKLTDGEIKTIQYQVSHIGRISQFQKFIAEDQEINPIIQKIFGNTFKFKNNGKISINKLPFSLSQYDRTMIGVNFHIKLSNGSPANNEREFITSLIAIYGHEITKLINDVFPFLNVLVNIKFEDWNSKVTNGIYGNGFYGTKKVVAIESSQTSFFTKNDLLLKQFIIKTLKK